MEFIFLYKISRMTQFHISPLCREYLEYLRNDPHIIFVYPLLVVEKEIPNERRRSDIKMIFYFCFTEIFFWYEDTIFRESPLLVYYSYDGGIK